MRLPTTIDDRTRSIGEGFAVDQSPEGVGTDPRLLHTSASVASRLGLTTADWEAPDFTLAMAGHAPIDGFSPFASVYAGHQFGHYVPQLGDGRAVMIAEGIDVDGAPFGLQLKGAGRTPYSRFGDGRAVMRSSIREYLCSEHMAALGIPTARALSLVATREGVQRDTVEPGAVVARLSESFIRFGHFEYFYHAGAPEKVGVLADHVMAHHFPDLVDLADPYPALFEEVTARTARLMAHWVAVGFTHGVMNTDNMSILGQTIDYGPFGFLDDYDPRFICNHTDQSGRYAFGVQPSVGLWNLSALASAFVGLVDADQLRSILGTYAGHFERQRDVLMAAKFGVPPSALSNIDAAGLLDLMTAGRADYTLTFRRLSRLVRGEDRDAFGIGFADDTRAGAHDWLERYLGQVDHSETTATEMDKANPAIVLRNWVAEHAIRAVEDNADLDTLDLVFRAMTAPFDPPVEAMHLAEPPPADMCGIALSCSS